ncbi:hypothetical protein BJ546DRAFT_435380 [Cryomyces antarcticus]
MQVMKHSAATRPDLGQMVFATTPPRPAQRTRWDLRLMVESTAQRQGLLEVRTQQLERVVERTAFRTIKSWAWTIVASPITWLVVLVVEREPLALAVSIVAGTRPPAWSIVGLVVIYLTLWLVVHLIARLVRLLVCLWRMRSR